MRKLRSGLQGNPGKLGSAVMAVTPVSEAGQQLLGTNCKKQFISSVLSSVLTPVLLNYLDIICL